MFFIYYHSTSSNSNTTGMANDSLSKRPITWKTTFQVKVGTGLNAIVYTLHTNPFTKRSSFFRAATSRSWRKVNAPIDLTDHDTGTFDGYLDCVYLGGLQANEDEHSDDEDSDEDSDVDDGNSDDDEDDDLLNMERMLDLYILADKLGDLKAASYVIDELVTLSDRIDSLPEDEVTNRIFDGAGASPLRKLLVDWYVHDAGGSFAAEEFSHDTLTAVFAEFARLRNLIADEGTHARNLFEAYIQYVERGKLPDAIMEDDDNDYTRADELLDLYILVDRLGDLTAANHVIDELIKYCDENDMMPDVATSDRIFHAVAQGGPVRNLLCSIDYRRFFEVTAGKGSKSPTYPVYIEPIIRRSSFFEAAVSPYWKKGDAPIDLSQHTTETFEKYLQCVYHDQVLCVTDGENNDEDTFNRNLSGLFDLYLLADEVGDLITANHTIDRMILFCDDHAGLPGDHLANRFFHKTTDYSKKFEVLVGQGSDQKTHMLPSDVFLPRSNFFRAAKSGRWSAGDAPVDLTDHTTEISNAYMHCVYFRKFLPPVVPSGNVAFTEYFQLHQLADKLGDLDAANLVVDGILSASNARKQVPHERSADFNRTFRVLVRSGTAQKIFTLHEDMFFPRSNFFKAARSEAWTTDDGKPVDLTDTTIATFNAHLHCVYLSKVPSVPAMSHTEYQPLSYNEGLMSKLVEIYILTDMLGDFTSANMVVDEIERQCHDIGVTFSVATMHRIYDATIVGSPLRKLLVDQYLREPTHKPIPAAEYPHALLAEIHESYIFRTGRDELSKSNYDDLGEFLTRRGVGDRCYYDVHNGKHPMSAYSNENDGSAFAHNQRYTKASTAYATPARPKVYRDSDTKSGVTLKRSFCAECGSSIFIESEAVEGLVILHCGVIDDAEARKPKFELFGEERRGWVGNVGSGKAKM
ncbi:hypothetical protein B0A48_05824 [Cryoendolithus antarcticus]|uniref:CENP-V/GFA domain-containing protein n=1 Tax=Cryoendolithus antarcticus TaxID=1507870 RepID=A0A1V8TCC5_9PEZI|nr:hypothetical protein B0A48_05824 [Cryoendolithus antarcticus]